jgi:SAM-dependent methyltransferase
VTIPSQPIEPRFQEQIVAPLQQRLVIEDAQFDMLFPPTLRWLSARHWTPVEVALRAAELLVEGPQSKILDVGSGVGKFSLIGALTTPGFFAGVEQRPTLVAAAQQAAHRLGVTRASFLARNMEEVDWRKFDAFYLYNPFYENLDGTTKIDDAVICDDCLFPYYIEIVQRKLSELRVGTRVVTYHGFGGSFPSGYERALQEPFRDDFLEMWTKTCNTS